MRLLALLALALLALPPLASAGNADYDTSRFSDHTGYNTQRKMARVGGDLYAAHVVAAVEPNTTRVVVLRIAADGTETELPEPRGGRGSTARPSLAVDTTGALHLAWTERAEDDREVFWARLEDGAWARPQQLSGGKGYAGFPSLAADAGGGMHVAWYGFDGTSYQVFYRHLQDGQWSPARQLSSGTLDANNPSVVVDAEGAVHVAWYKDDGHSYQVWHARRAPSGVWDLPRRLSQGEGEAYNAALAVDRAGNVHVAWDELHADGYRVMHASPPGAPARTLARAAQGGEYPAIAAWGGGMLVAWGTADGRLLATDLSGVARPLLGGAHGRHPSLRGPVIADGDATLDVLWTGPEEDGWRVRRVSLADGCSPFEAPRVCQGAAREAPGPGPLLALLAVLAAARIDKPAGGFLRLARQMRRR